MIMTDKRKRLTPLDPLFRFVGILLLLAGLIWLLPAQDVGKNQAENLLKNANEISVSGQYDSALVAYRQARDLARKEADPVTIARSLAQIGVLYSRKQQLAKAHAYLDSALAMAGAVDSMDRSIFFARKEKAFLRQNDGDVEGAIHDYQSLIEDLEQASPEADSLLAMAYDAIAQSLWQSGDLQGALERAQQARKNYLGWNNPKHPGLAYCENTLGIIQMYLSDYDAAIAHFSRSVELLVDLFSDDHPHVIAIRGNIGVLYGEQGLYREALGVYEANLPYLNQLEPSQHLNGLINMAGVLIVLEDYAEARRYLNQASRYLEDFPSLKPSALPYILHQSSVVAQSLGDPETAIELSRTSISRLRARHGNESAELFDDYLQIGDLFQNTGQKDSARWYFREGMNISMKIYGEQSQKTASVIQDLGEMALTNRRYNTAVQHFLRAADMYERVGHATGQIGSLIWAAEATRESGQPEEALSIHRHAWERMLPDMPFSQRPDPAVSRQWETLNILYLLKEQGKTVKALSAHSGDSQQMRDALACFETALDVLDSLRMFSLATKSGGIMIRNHRDLYEDAIATSLDLATSSGEDAYKLRAWGLADRARANLLRDYIRGMEAMEVAGIPDSLLKKERYFRQRIAYLRNQASLADPAAADSMKTLAFALTQDYKALVDHVEATFPRYFSLKYQSEALDPRELMGELDRDQAVVSFFWGKESLYIFSAFREAPTVRVLPLDETLKGELDAWLGFISQPPADGSSVDISTPHRLFGQLLPEVNEDVERLLIVPDGRLSYLPFESLLVEKTASNRYRDCAYLGRQVALTYVPSLSLWMESEPNDDTYARYVGFAPTFSEGMATAGRVQLRPLTFSTREVEETAALLGGIAWVGAGATESRLRQLEEDFFVYHFATHALTGEDGRLFLAASDSAGSEDGILHASELYGMSLQSPLVVLSACETSTGELQQGEGLLSLARAFQYIGADRVMAGLWSTDDEAGYALVTGFFDELKKGRSTGESLLRSRQAWMEASPDAQCHPYYWSGLVLIGDDTDLLLEVNRGLPWWEIFIGSFVLLFAYLWWWSRGNKGANPQPE